jgi:hypothetical protein
MVLPSYTVGPCIGLIAIAWNAMASGDNDGSIVEAAKRIRKSLKIAVDGRKAF